MRGRHTHTHNYMTMGFKATAPLFFLLALAAADITSDAHTMLRGHIMISRVPDSNTTTLLPANKECTIEFQARVSNNPTETSIPDGKITMVLKTEAGGQTDQASTYWHDWKPGGAFTDTLTFGSCDMRDYEGLRLTYEPYLAPAKTVTLAYYKVTMTTPLQFQATYTGPELVVPADAWIETSNIEHSIQH